MGRRGSKTENISDSFTKRQVNATVSLPLTSSKCSVSKKISPQVLSNSSWPQSLIITFNFGARGEFMTELHDLLFKQPSSKFKHMRNYGENGERVLGRMLKGCLASYAALVDSHCFNA